MFLPTSGCNLGFHELLCCSVLQAIRGCTVAFKYALWHTFVFHRKEYGVIAIICCSVLLFFFCLGFTPSPVAQPQPSAGLNVDFESVFGNKSSNVIVDSGGKRLSLILMQATNVL